MLNAKPIVDGQLLEVNINKVVCIGRNYIQHAIELNNPIPDCPLLFIKPNSTLCSFSDQVILPSRLGLVHHELEISILLGKSLGPESSLNEVESSVLGVGLALDLTLRDVQNKLKEKGHPWERAKCFPGSCPISPFIGIDSMDGFEDLKLQLVKNGKVQQKGSVTEMIYPIFTLVQQMAEIFTLDPGDIILTGTPSGVSALEHGDILNAELISDKPLLKAQCQIIRR